ncbi:MAG TPA: NAD(P)/FAD-dependent oxidoreductase [Candidatus Acidoferrales bacterium]|nr:NAD(P)/FAD-dependent oxidoreductase [Candidatus Acidoferrales bacterium]
MNPSIRQIAILGGGPAGSICGERLSREGFSVTIYDEHLAWEKPCGGGLTQKALAAFPFLLSSPAPKKPVSNVELIASDGERARFKLDWPIVIYARKVLNGLLLDRAADSGCEIVQARVTALDVEGPGARLEAGGGWHQADFVVIAAGARNALLPQAQSLTPEDLELTLGYYIPGESDLLKVKFVRGLQGYLWSFPRLGHLSVGICASMGKHVSRELRSLLNQFIKEEKLDTAGAELYSHILPSPRRRTLQERSVVGKNWALVGDAAAWVDPVTGEGIYYAMRSGEILAEALIEGNPQEYPARVQTAFRQELEIAAKLSPFFYNGRFLGGAVTTRMIAFARHSATFRQMLADVFAGSQSYRTLKARLWRQLGLTLTETAGSLLHRQPRDPAEVEA